MGYTNYFYSKPLSKFPQKLIDQLKSLEKIVEERHINCYFEFNEKYVSIEGSCETLVLQTNAIRKPWQEVREDGGIFDCCKTRAFPYDAIVKAAIMAGMENGLVVEWSFDGDVSEKEYEDALEIAKLAGIKECPPKQDG